MLADGLTKALSAIKFEQFRKAIGVVDVSQQLAARAVKEITAERLEAREDLFKGGEAEVVDHFPDSDVRMDKSKE
jgi:hypothetical protein